jgi:hypothetical protein
MQLGDESWKWALVIVLLGVLVAVGNQAYKSVYNPENQFDPPDDYLKGDSFDIERGLAGGPAAGQPVDVPETLPVPLPDDGAPTPPAGEAPPPPPPTEEPDWSKLEGAPAGK